MDEQVPRVVIGMDPHKRSVTIEVMTADETVVGGGRFDTSVEGYQEMLEHVAACPDRVWAIEGCEGIGRHIAHRLIADGQDVVDVPAKLSARARVFATGQGRKTDATDAHSVAYGYRRGHALGARCWSPASPLGSALASAGVPHPARGPAPGAACVDRLSPAAAGTTPCRS